MKIAVYCGSTAGNDPAYAEHAEKLGKWIAGKGHELIYGGGDAGLMGVVARAAFENGGRVTGVLPGNIPFIADRPQPYCTRVLTEPDMAARKKRMMELAEAYIALPGGIGTLDEITEVMCLIRIHELPGRAVLYNIGGFYDCFRQQVARMIGAGYMAEQDLERVLFSDSLEEMESFLG